MIKLPAHSPNLLAASVALLLASPIAQADLTAMDDASLADVSGQGGITLEAGVNMAIGAASYFDDGNGIRLEGVKVGSASGSALGAFHKIDIDILNDASLLLTYDIKDRRIEVTDIRLSDNLSKSMGGFFMDHDIAGTLKIHSGGALSANGFTFDSQFAMTNGRLGYRTNGNEVFFDNMTMNVNAPGMTLDVSGNALVFNTPSLTGNFSIGAIRYSNNPLNHGNSFDVTSGAALKSYGGISGDFDLSAQYTIAAGGRFGAEGLMINGQMTINSANFVYSDDGNLIALRGISGFLKVTNLGVDVAKDWNNRLGLALTVERFEGRLDINRIEMGASGKSIGSVAIDFLFQDQIVDGQNFTNAVFVQAGGHKDAGPQGLRFATEWSLANASVAYTDNGNKVIFSGLQSWGRGDLTVNVTKAGIINGTEFFDGIRLGFENVVGGYRIDGLRVGDENASLQGGTELLLALGLYPAFEFEVNGQVTLGAGGRTGSGITINSDIHITKGRAAFLTDENGSGLWASDLDYDIHVRNMTIDVTDQGLAIIQGESWSTMDIGNLRIGNKLNGGSFGRVVLQRYETGSELRITPGGAGALCVGGSGGDATACAASGGEWENRGNEGVTIGLKNVFAKAISDTKRNRLTWETNRQTGGNGAPVNDTGMKLVFNDFHTSDGDGASSNTFGIQTDLNVDVHQTKVVKKTTGADSNGVFGNLGDEKILDASTTAGYRYVASPTAADKTNRPLGFAVQARTQFKELSVNNIDLVHPQGGAQTAIYGVKLQNFDIRANLTATPID